MGASKSLKAIRPKQVKIELNGAEHVLCYDMNAFGVMEEKYDNIELAMKAVQTGKITALRYVLWAGLVSEWEELTEKELGKLIGLVNLRYIAEMINEALSDALPPAQEGTIPNVPK